MSQVTCDQLFGTPIWHIESELPEGAIDWALSIEKNVENQNGKRSGRLGYQSPHLSTMHTARGALQHPMTNWDEFPYFDHVKKELDFLPQFKFNNYWVNVNRKNAYNVKHTHPCVDLSVVWYLTDSMGLMVIEHPMVHTRTHLYEKIGYGVNFSMNIPAGHLIVFPSDLPHYVEPHDLDDPRITVALNLNVI